MNQADLDRIWYGGEPVPVWMRVLTPVYRVLGGLARWPYRAGWLKPARMPVPVVVVGNLTAGGTGKTPLILALIEGLRKRGWNPGVISRGYGGSARTTQRLDDVPDPAIVGDEPCLIRYRSGAPVVIGRQRVEAARLVVGDGVDVILADDGLQNPSLARDVEICVIDGRRRFGNGRLLPAGPLRESTARLATVDWVVCHGGEPGTGEIPMTLSGSIAVRLDDPTITQPLHKFVGQQVHAIAAIGHPARFFDSLREHRIRVIEHAFRDHHALTPADLEFSDDLPILMTEKDAVKCRGFAGPHRWHVPVTAELPETFFDASDERLREIVLQDADKR
jgi:tetraacyldisaccharide 4'-kinase